MPLTEGGQVGLFLIIFVNVLWPAIRAGLKPEGIKENDED